MGIRVPGPARQDARGGQLSWLHRGLPADIHLLGFRSRESLPTPLRQFAEVNPFTIVVNELRWLWTGQPSPDHLWQAFAWVVFILAVFSPLAVQRYRRAASR